MSINAIMPRDTNKRAPISSGFTDSLPMRMSLSRLACIFLPNFNWTNFPQKKHIFSKKPESFLSFSSVLYFW